VDCLKEGITQNKLRVGIMFKMLSWLKEYFKAGEDMLPNGCVPSGHKFSPYHMCVICGEYK
jgi:hypothetical protein